MRETAHKYREIATALLELAAKTETPEERDTLIRFAHHYHSAAYEIEQRLGAAAA